MLVSCGGALRARDGVPGHLLGAEGRGCHSGARSCWPLREFEKRQIVLLTQRTSRIQLQVPESEKKSPTMMGLTNVFSVSRCGEVVRNAAITESPGSESGVGLQFPIYEQPRRGARQKCGNQRRRQLEKASCGCICAMGILGVEFGAKPQAA